MITKNVSIILTDAEIESSEDIEIQINIHSETDPENEEGVTYTITYPKK